MSVAHQQIASLQAMGIDVYLAYRKQAEQPALVIKPWFNDLLNLLGLTQDDCQFSDALPISFDPINRKLQLPFTLTSHDALLKRKIWQHIKGDVAL